MKLAIILSTFVLTACVATPVARNFPEAPAELKTACQPLATIDENTVKLSEVVKSVTTNYGYYQDCADKNSVWNRWYQDQKQIFDSVK